MATVRIYPDEQEVVLKRSAPPSGPSVAPGPADVRIVPGGRDLTIEVAWLAGQRFHYWLPENVAGVAFHEHDPWSGEEPEGALCYESAHEGVAVRVRAQGGRDELAVELHATNTSSGPWLNHWLNCCLGLWDASDFGGDKAMARTFAVHEGRLKPLREVNPWAGSASLKTFYPLAGVPHTAYWDFQSETRKLCPQRVDEGFIIVVGARSGAAVGLGWDRPAQCVFNNTDDAFQCIHAAPLLERVEPGQTFSAAGIVCFERSGAEACLRRLRESLGVNR
jgi:hypothetical protein